jgi:hypothetical protein
MNSTILLLVLTTLSGQLAGQSSFPSADISNGIIRCKLYLPDSERGYYRGARFDWSGVIASLEYSGHNFFGQWFEHYDPKLHDAITGPVEEFRSEDGALGYSDAKAGDTFVKIGVGVLRKPEEEKYAFSHAYEIVDPGKWTMRAGTDQVEFTQRLDNGSGYAYDYRKTVRLTRDQPQLVLEHSLKNTGSKLIDTSVYDHDFFVIDNQPSGPEFTVDFHFLPRATQNLKNLIEIRGQRIVYLRDLEKGESVGTYLEGFGPDVSDNDIRVENQKVGVGVRQRGDRPLSNIYFWSVRTTVCPEAYIHLRIPPGQQATWRISYDFYSIEKPKAQTK